MEFKQQVTNRWIDIREKEPPMDETIIVYGEKYIAPDHNDEPCTVRMVGASYYCEVSFVNSYKIFPGYKKVYYWMSLPKPPTVDELSEKIDILEDDE